ncbi:MAG TPA: competence/damage-inducible protein A [Acidimicrobiales bacterium]|nr:competence/damage-inducible protein A [Acidimicrobiales bacterium]
MRVEVVAIGSELLLGQIADTNSKWLGEQLAAAGVTSHFHQHVGDNPERILLALRTALARSDGVIVCGGLGPTQDDITREAIAQVMGVPLERDDAIAARIEAMFRSRGREMPENNRRQADVPRGATIIEQRRGTAPGLICPVGNKVVYAVPGVPYELEEMFERAILADLRRRLTDEGTEGVIASRVLRTWGASESGLAEVLDARLHELDGSDATIAFLASGIEGLKVRLTVRAASLEAAGARLDHEEAAVRSTLQASLGDIVFGVDTESMEHAVAHRLMRLGLTLGLAESVTGGLVASRLVGVIGASSWFRGSVVSYASDVKRTVLGVGQGSVVTSLAAQEMADGARRVLRSDVSLSLTGVAGPDKEDDVDVGTVFVGICLPGEPAASSELHLPGDRQRVREYAAISALDLLRRRLDSLTA